MKWKVEEGQGRSWKGVSHHWIDISDEKSYMLMACRIIVSAPVPVPFLWTLDFGFGFETWIWDLDLGLDLGLTIFTVVERRGQDRLSSSIIQKLCV